MKSLNQVRKAYDENYESIQTIIKEMGGDLCIKEHRVQQSRLFRRLKELQRKEHQLNALESRLSNSQYQYVLSPGLAKQL